MKVMAYSSGVKGLDSATLAELGALLRAGNLVLFPSDTCYAIAGLPFRPGLTEELDRALNRRGESISISFDTERRLRQWARVDAAANVVLEDPPRGALTVVLPARSSETARKAAQHLFSPGNLGTRLPHSQIERELVSAARSPLTTIAVRSGDTPIKSWSDAAYHVMEALDSMGSSRRVGLVKGPNLPAGEVSTVIALRQPTATEPHAYEVLREGAITTRALRRWARSLARRHVNEWGL